MEPIGSLQAGALHTEKVLQQISEQVARLASAVSNISAALEVRATHGDLRAAGERSEGKFSSVEERLSRLERAVTVRTNAANGMDQDASVGLHVARLYAQLEATNQELSQRASSASLANVQATLTDQLNEHVQVVMRERASQEQMTRMEQAHDALSSQVAAVESACANKIDSARLAGLETTVSRLREFSTFRQSTEKRLKILEKEAANISSDLLKRSEAAKNIETIVSKMRQRLRDDTPHNEDLLDLHEKFETNLNNALDDASDNIQAILTQRMNDIRKNLHKDISENKNKLIQHDNILLTHDDDINSKASITELNLKTNITEHDELENMVTEGLKRRAAVRTVRTVQKDLNDLIKKCSHLEKVSILSQRFIEWFHNRGSVYEQNCQTIERQLNSLVVGSDPRVRQPFVNQVRIDSVGEVVSDDVVGNVATNDGKSQQEA